MPNKIVVHKLVGRPGAYGRLGELFQDDPQDLEKFQGKFIYVN